MQSDAPTTTHRSYGNYVRLGSLRRASAAPMDAAGAKGPPAGVRRRAAEDAIPASRSGAHFHAEAISLDDLRIEFQVGDAGVRPRLPYREDARRQEIRQESPGGNVQHVAFEVVLASGEIHAEREVDDELLPGLERVEPQLRVRHAPIVRHQSVGRPERHEAEVEIADRLVRDVRHAERELFTRLGAGHGRAGGIEELRLDDLHLAAPGEYAVALRAPDVALHHVGGGAERPHLA